MIETTSGLNRNPSPEVEIMLCCARSRMDERARRRLSEVLDLQIDWPYLMHAAHLHGVTPLVYGSLYEEAREQVPTAVMQQLKLRCVQSVAHNRFLTETLLELLDLFSQHQIDAIPLKGPVLAAAAYGNPALREFADLDIMVERGDVTTAVDLLMGAGYRRFSKSRSTEPVRDLLKKRVRKDAGLIRDDGLVCVEIHWDFLPKARSFPLRPAHAWRSTRQVSVAGTSVSAFSMEHMLVFLCAHGTKHAWMRLKWICDVAEIIRSHPAIDWERVIHEARRLRGERMLRLGLHLAAALLGAELPRRVRSYVSKDPEALSLAEGAFNRLAAGREEIERWEESVFWIRSREKMRDKIPGMLFYLIRNLISPSSRDQDLVSLPRPLFFLYYLVRPVRIILERHGFEHDPGHRHVAAATPNGKGDVL